MIECSTPTCRNFPETEQFKRCKRCRDRSRNYTNAKVAAGFCRGCGHRRAKPNRRHCKHCAHKAGEYAKTHRTSLAWHYKYQAVVFDHYGKRCNCCGETNPIFLTIDHINGRDGTPEKGQSGYSVVSRVARSIIKGEPRTDIQILCYNCNCGRYRNGGICPHKETETWQAVS